MGKGHKDNHKARVKRGSVAFEKKAERRNKKRIACNLCGTVTRPGKLLAGICPVCVKSNSVFSVAKAV